MRWPNPISLSPRASAASSTSTPCPPCRWHPACQHRTRRAAVQQALQCADRGQDRRCQSGGSRPRPGSRTWTRSGHGRPPSPGTHPAHAHGRPRRGSPDMRRMSAACPQASVRGIGAWRSRSRIRPAVKTAGAATRCSAETGSLPSWILATSARIASMGSSASKRASAEQVLEHRDPGGAQRRLPVLRGRGLIQELLEQHRHHAFIGLACCQIIERAPADDQFSTIAIHLRTRRFPPRSLRPNLSPSHAPC